MKIPFVIWRNGRPRFEPSPSARKAGHKGHDLKNADGTWMSEGQALDFSRAFETARKAERAKAKPSPQAAGKTAVKPKISPRSYTVADLFKEWLGAAAVREKAPNTIKDYHQKARVIEDCYKDIWSAQAEALSRPVMFGLYDRIKREKGPHTANSVLRLFSNAIKWGMNRGKLTGLVANPAQRLEMTKLAPRVRFATIEELDALISTADAMGRPEMGDMFTLAVWSGQRQGDRINMQMINLDGGRLICQQAKTWAIVNMPVAPPLAARLEAARERRKAASIISPALILDERTWQPFKPDYYRHLFEDIRVAAAKACPSVADLRDQDLRDTAVTWLALAGCDIWEICSITGHSFKTAADVLKHYLAIHPDMATSAMNKMHIWYEGKTKK